MATRFEEYDPYNYELTEGSFWTKNLKEAAFYVAFENAKILDERINQSTGEFEVCLLGEFYFTSLSETQKSVTKLNTRNNTEDLFTAYKKLRKLKKRHLERKGDDYRDATMIKEAIIQYGVREVVKCLR